MSYTRWRDSAVKQWLFVHFNIVILTRVGKKRVASLTGVGLGRSMYLVDLTRTLGEYRRKVGKEFRFVVARMNKN